MSAMTFSSSAEAAGLPPPNEIMLGRVMYLRISRIALPVMPLKRSANWMDSIEAIELSLFPVPYAKAPSGTS